MEIESDSSRSICEGCLSVDRKITPLKDEECRKFFMETLSVEHREMLPINLCWECTALTRKAVKFKNQIRIAHRSIIDCMTYLNGQSLSCLNVKIQSKPMELNHDEIVSGDVLTTKTEINADYYCNVYEKGFQDEDVKTDFQYEIVLEKEEESNEATPQLDFSDSDDEPLTLKKEKKQEREKKVKLKKEERDSMRKRKRREKPAGVVDNQRVKKVLRELNVASGQLEMVVLTWDQVAAERDRALTSEVFTRHDYRCYDCVLGFNHRFKLENHMKKHDPSSGTSVCEVCKVRFRDSHALCAHNRRHRVRWRCVACGSLWSRAAVGADHVARAHQAPPPTHTCAACGHTETSLGRLRNHIKSHGERQKCDICGKTFKDRNSLRTHLFIHRGVKEYSCPQCDKRFLFKKSMEVHLVTHDAPAHLYCVQCDMNFKNQMSYYQHMKYNLKHIDPSKLKYACELCEKKFVKSSRLQEHHLAVHLKVTPVQCPEEGCHFSCSSRTVLRSHTRAVHRGKKAARNHVCHTCGKTYTSKKSLEGHLRSHTGERPFHCTLCPVSFGYEAALYNHNKLVHLKIKRGQERSQATAPTVTSTWEMAVNIPPDTQASGS